MRPILCKDSATQRLRTPNLFECFAEVQPILCKDSANREQKVKLA